MQHSYAKLVCLSGTIFFAQQTFSSPKSAVGDDDLDLVAIAHEAQQSFDREQAKLKIQRYKQYRSSKSLSIDTADRTTAMPFPRPPELQIAHISVDPSPIVEWFSFCQFLYAVEQGAHTARLAWSGLPAEVD